MDLNYHRFEYTLLILSCFLIPFLYTIIHRRILKRYRFFIINPSVIIAALPFIAWDMFAVRNGHWQFNPRYTLPWNIAGLPLEEFLFFLLVPQSCLLIWVAFKRYSSFSQVKSDIMKHFKKKE